MNKRKWAFIYTAPGCSEEDQHCVLTSPKHRSLMYGVGSVEEGCRLAARLEHEGCKLIELCGGFGPEGTKKVIEAVGGRIPVGYITYFPEEWQKLQAQKSGAQQQKDSKNTN